MRRMMIPSLDHLVFKQVTFGKDCTIALLPNGAVHGFGHSKHRHFLDKPGKNHCLDDTSIIPLVVKEQAQNAEERRQQRQITKICTFSHTTICVTEAGVVYASGDRFATTLQIDKSKLPFGFYPIPCDPRDAPKLPLDTETDNAKEPA